VKKCLFF